MSSRDSTRRTFVCAVALLLVAGASVQAQDSTRTRADSVRRATSQQRIRVSKSGGEVALPRITAREQARLDSIARAEQMRRDSIANIERLRQDSINAEQARFAAIEKARLDSLANVEKMRQDSINSAEAARVVAERARADSVSRADALERADQLRRDRMRSKGVFGGSGWYIGVSGGPTNAASDFKNLGYGNGYGINVPIGWHPLKQVLGIQLDLGYNQFNGATFQTGGTAPVTLSNPDPKVFSGVLNARLRFPFNENRTAAVYFLGGGGVYMFQNFGTGSALAGFLGNDVLNPNDGANKTTIDKWGVNGAAGLEWGIGTASIFAESRLVNVWTRRTSDVTFDNIFGQRSETLRWFPINIGVMIR
jgi:hypothetical protein